MSSSLAELQSTHSSTSVELERLRKEHAFQSESLRSTKSSLETSKSELDVTTTSLGTERKRAEAAEKKKAALQSENDNLLRQLEEVRQKVTTVMEEKADLAEALDSAKSKIPKVDIDQAVKKLEADLQASTSRVQLLTRQLADLQSAYTSLQSSASSGNTPTPSREVPPQSNRPTGVNRTVDAILPANVRHKRQVSIAALKARMGTANTRRGMDSLAEHPGERKQFGDEIMFCCPACEGDLITL